MSENRNPNTNTQERNDATVAANVDKLTTRSLGIADAKAKDLAGYVINPYEITTAVNKVFLAIGVSRDNIRAVRVGLDKNGKVHIIAEIAWSALKRKSTNNYEDAIVADYSGGDNGLNPVFFSALHNKIYHGKKKHLRYHIVKRTDKKHGKKDSRKYVSIEINPEIFIAFVYNINFRDPWYKISAKPVRLKDPTKYKDKDDVTDGEKVKFRQLQGEYREDHLESSCNLIVTFKPNYVYDENDVTGFTTRGVDEWFNNIEKK
jgi:hypothetical protein